MSAMIDLAKLLAVDGKDLPRQKITFQFDNCSENKVSIFLFYVEIVHSIFLPP